VIWDQLPELTRRSIISQIRDGLHLARDTAGSISETTHEPYGSPGKPMRHYHVHHLAGDRTHAHVHQHENDALHIGHPHGEDGGEADDVSRTRIFNAGPPQARQAHVYRGKDPWAALTRLATQLERGQR
jgi:hypothetical protein